jgi:hypothetical protein
MTVSQMASNKNLAEREKNTIKLGVFPFYD